MNSAQAAQIHEASLELLADPGVRFEHENILALLRRHGARPGAAADVLRLPREMIRDALAAAPSTVELADRAGGGRTLTPDGPGCVWSVPGMNMFENGLLRPFTSSDMAGVSRLLDRLSELDGVFGLAMDDVPPAARDVAGLRIMAENTAKHIRVLCFTPAGAECLCEMRRAVADTPWFSIGFTAHGPLRWTNLALEIFARTAGHRIPTTINGEPMAGVSGPVTLAGSAAVGNAEILAGLVVNQLLEPGRPCIYNLGLAHLFDMRTSIAVTGAPENHLFAGVSAAMGRFYSLPSCSWVSTESMCPDSQAAFEKGIGFLTHLQSGVSLVWGVGQLESELTFCPAQAVIDNEMVAYARRYLRGVEVNPDTLAVAAAREVGISGDFLACDHTLEHFRAEFFEPALSCRRKRAAWEGEGSRALHERAADTAAALMAEPAREIMAPEAGRALRAIEDAFRAGL